jgi:hypothetical protein
VAYRVADIAIMATFLALLKFGVVMFYGFTFQIHGVLSCTDGWINH